ncbi:hypothetical protein ACOSQ3_006811 [Xanthoceras sorbifolium]
MVGFVELNGIYLYGCRIRTCAPWVDVRESIASGSDCGNLKSIFFKISFGHSFERSFMNNLVKRKTAIGSKNPNPFGFMIMW